MNAIGSLGFSLHDVGDRAARLDRGLLLLQRRDLAAELLRTARRCVASHQSNSSSVSAAVRLSAGLADAGRAARSRLGELLDLAGGERAVVEAQVLRAPTPSSCGRVCRWPILSGTVVADRALAACRPRRRRGCGSPLR